MDALKISLFLSICITDRSFLRKNISIFWSKETKFHNIWSKAHHIWRKETLNMHILFIYIYTHAYMYVYIYIYHTLVYRCVYVDTYLFLFIYIEKNTYTHSIYTLTLLFLFPLKGPCVSQHPPTLQHQNDRTGRFSSRCWLDRGFSLRSWWLWSLESRASRSSFGEGVGWGKLSCNDFTFISL